MRKEVVQALSTLGRSAGLKGFELVKDVRLEAGGLWTPTDEECILTPTFKLKRKQVLCSSVQQFGLPYMSNSFWQAKDRYQAEIDEMYASVKVSGTTFGLCSSDKVKKVFSCNGAGCRKDGRASCLSRKNKEL